MIKACLRRESCQKLCRTMMTMTLRCRVLTRLDLKARQFRTPNHLQPRLPESCHQPQSHNRTFQNLERQCPSLYLILALVYVIVQDGQSTTPSFRPLLALSIHRIVNVFHSLMYTGTSPPTKHHSSSLANSISCTFRAFFLICPIFGFGFGARGAAGKGKPVRLQAYDDNSLHTGRLSFSRFPWRNAASCSR